VFSTDKNTLEELKARTPDQRRIKALLMELSGITKVKETLKGKKNDTGLLNKLCDSRIHPRFNQCVTTTGRLSSSDPNAQNLPRGNTSPIKQIILPRYDHILQFDLSQIEWRAAAYLSQDPVMMYEINHGVDQHVAACVDIMKLPFIDKHDPVSKENRTYAKIFNFRMIYGGSPYGFYKDSKMPAFRKEEWVAIVNDFYNKYRGLKEWQDTNISTSLVTGSLRLSTGRWFAFNKMVGADGVPAYNERHVKNYPVQGFAGGDLLPFFIVLLRQAIRANGLSSQLLLTVHDSVVLDVPDDELRRVARLCYLLMRGFAEFFRSTFGVVLNVDLAGECEYGPNYGDLKEITYEETLEHHA